MYYSQLVKTACSILFQAHRDDLDKGGYPYVFHPFYLATQMDDEASTCVALLYVLSPLDLVPDSVPLLGKLDDAYAIAVSVAKLLRGTERDVILRHWLGEPETIDSVRAWLDYFDNKLGSGLMKKVMHTLRRA